MNKEKILQKAQLERNDEGKQYINNFSISTTGAFLMLLLAILTGVKFFLKQNYFDTLGLLIGGLGAYFYGQYVNLSPVDRDSKRRFFSKYTLIFFVAIVLMGLGLDLIIRYIRDIL